jgi:hypothetical protein
MARILLALLCAGHGVAHLVGFFAAWRPGLFPALPHKTTILAGQLNIGEAGIRIVGVLWLGMALVFAWAAVLMWLKGASAANVVMWVAAVSIVLSVLEWPDSQIGVVVNLSIVLLILAGLRYGWLTNVHR